MSRFVFGKPAYDRGGGSVGFVAEPLLGRDRLFPVNARHGLDAHARWLAAGGGSHEMPEALDHVQADPVGFARVLPDPITTSASATMVST
jgi:hypothetical protein